MYWREGEKSFKDLIFVKCKKILLKEGGLLMVCEEGHVSGLPRCKIEESLKTLPLSV